MWQEVDGVTTVVPLDPNEPVSLSSEEGSVEITLPFSEGAELLDTDADGLIAFDNKNDSTTTAVMHDDDSVQVNTIIEGPGSPTRYDCGIDMPAGASMAVVEGGAVEITSADGELIGGIAPAWAKDALGGSVQTLYEVTGSTLTQVVDHSSEDRYPVMADPWLGKRLFGKVTRGIWKGDYTYNAWVTLWGAVVLSGGGGVGGYVAGGVIFREAGWQEWKNAWPAVSNKAALKQQYDCHVAAGFTAFLSRRIIISNAFARTARAGYQASSVIAATGDEALS